MKPTGACGRADLVRALARGDPALADALAGLLGFEVAAEPVIDAAVQLTGVAATGEVGSITITVPPEIQTRPLIEIPFWRLEGYESVVPEESSPERRPISAVPVVWRNRPDARHPPARALARTATALACCLGLAARGAGDRR